MDSVSLIMFSLTFVVGFIFFIFGFSELREIFRGKEKNMAAPAMGTIYFLICFLFWLVLGLYWPAMNRVGAIAAMASGLGVSFYYIVSNHPWVQMRLQLSPQDTIWWGLDPTCAAVFGVPMGLFLGYVFSKVSVSKNCL